MSPRTFAASRRQTIALVCSTLAGLPSTAATAVREDEPLFSNPGTKPSKIRDHHGATSPIEGQDKHDRHDVAPHKGK